MKGSALPFFFACSHFLGGGNSSLAHCLAMNGDREIDFRRISAFSKRPVKRTLTNVLFREISHRIDCPAPSLDLRISLEKYTKIRLSLRISTQEYTDEQ